MSDGTLVIDTALDLDGLKKDLPKYEKNIQAAATSMAETIATDASEALIENMLKTLGKGVLEALEESMTPEEADAFGKKLGNMAAKAYIEGMAQEDFNTLGQNLIKDVESGAKEVALAAGENIGDDVAGGIKNELNADVGEKAGSKVQDGLEDELGKDEGEKLGKATGKGIGEGIEEGAKPGISGVGDLIKGILTADAIKGFAKSAFNTIKEFAMEGIELASDLQEVQNVVDVTFGDSAESINKWSKDAKKSYGMSELSAKKFNGTIGAMFKSMGKTEGEAAEMSTTMVGLAGDMASFYNLEHEEAFNKIRAGISGETEPLKQLGINMSVANLEAYALSQGIDKSYSSMTQAEQATLRYNYLLEATADAQGDFVRNGDSYANQMKLWDANVNELQTTIGTALLPVLTDAVSWLNNLFDGTGKTGLSAEVKGAIDSLSSLRDDVKTVEQDYAKKTIQIQVEYETSLDLLEEYKTLESQINITEADSSRMAEIVALLIENYEGLDQYVGANGLFNKESSEIETLIGKYSALEKQQALFEKAKELEALSGESTLNLELLESEKRVRQDNIDGLKAYNDELSSTYNIIDGLEKIGTVSTGGPFAVATHEWTTDVDKQADALRALFDVTEGFASIDLSGTDFEKLIKDGKLLSADEIRQDAEALAVLPDVLKAGREQLKTLMTESESAINAEADAIDKLIETEEEYGDEAEKTAIKARAANRIIAEGLGITLDQYEQLSGAGFDYVDMYDALIVKGQSVEKALENQTHATQDATAATTEAETAIAKQITSMEALDDAYANGEISAAAYEARQEELRAEQELLASSLALTADQMNELNKTYGISTSELRELSAAGVTYEQIVAAAKLGAETTDGVVSKLIGRSEEDVARLRAAGLSYQTIIDDMETGGTRIQQVLDASDEEAAKVVAKTITVEEMVARIAEAKKAGSDAEAAMETAKENMGEDAKTILEQMQGVLTTIGVDIDALVTSVPGIIKEGEEGATTAGRDLAKATGDGYREETPLKDAVIASLSEALGTLVATNSTFNNAGRNIVDSIAQGVKDNSSTLANAVRDVVQDAIAVANSSSLSSYGDRFGYPHRAGLDYVPYDEYPAVLHKGEAVLTAAEAALWRGGMYVQETGSSSASIDPVALAQAIWAEAPEGGDISIVMDSETVGRLTEPTISARQGRSIKG